MATSSSTHPALALWLADHLPSADLQLSPLRVEASHRRFYRVSDGERSWVAMDSPPDQERNDAFVELARGLHAHGVPVPELIACDLARGYVLMSDLGRTELIDVYGGNQQDSAVLRALEALKHLQTLPLELAPPYTEERFYMELGIFEEWFVEGLLGQPKASALRATWPTLVAVTQSQPQCVVHRDFHCQNLLLNEQGEIGMVDFQDALIGPALYDVASLLHDCYYDFSPCARSRYLHAYCASSPFFDKALPTLPVEALELTALQRQLKAIGIFARLKLRDGKTSHLKHIAYCLQHCIEIAARYPATAALARALRALQPIATAALPEATR